MLREAGGFELMRTGTVSRTQLEAMYLPAGGYTSVYLADESGLGQAICFIRPIQMDLPLVQSEEV
jgi:hypothetical protein